MHTKPIGIEFDPDKAETNMRKHGVGFADAEQAMQDPHAATMSDPDAVGEPRFLTMGMDAAGRVLVVVWTPRDDLARIISARKASKGEANTYAQ